MLVLDIEMVNQDDYGSHVICTFGFVDGVVRVVSGEVAFGQLLMAEKNMFIEADIDNDPELWMEDFAEHCNGSYIWATSPYVV